MLYIRTDILNSFIGGKKIRDNIRISINLHKAHKSLGCNESAVYIYVCQWRRKKRRILMMKKSWAVYLKSIDQREVRKYEQMQWTALAFTQTAAMTGIRRR